jgi:hypothetical protein
MEELFSITEYVYFISQLTTESPLFQNRRGLHNFAAFFSFEREKIQDRVVSFFNL